jgi:hypothetical protein
VAEPEPAAPDPIADDPTRPEPLSPADQLLAIARNIETQQAATSERLDLLAGDIDELSAQTTAGRPSPDDSDERLTAVEGAVKWATPWRNLAVLVSFFVVGGIGVLAALANYAEKAVIDTVKEAHSGDEPAIEPSVRTVEQLKQDVGAMKGGVDCLVGARKRTKAIKNLEVQLEPYRQQHQDLIQEWTANKAARRRTGDKPTKTDGHLALEAELKKLAAAPEEQCSEKDKP